MANWRFLKSLFWRGARDQNAPVATPVLVFCARSLAFLAQLRLPHWSAGHHVVGGGSAPIGVTMLLEH